jgi:WD40 repeat protein
MTLVNAVIILVIGAVMGVLADWLIKSILPSRPTRAHAVAVVFAILCMGFAAAYLSEVNQGLLGRVISTLPVNIPLLPAHRPTASIEEYGLVRQIQTPFEHTATHNWSPDADEIVLGEARIERYRIEDGTALGDNISDVQTGMPSLIRIMPDGGAVTAVSAIGGATYEFGTRKRVSIWQGDNCYRHGECYMDWVPNTNNFVTSYLVKKDDNEIPVFAVRDSQTGDTIAQFTMQSRATAIKVSPDGKLVAIGDPLGRVGIWNIATGQAEVTLDANLQHWIEDIDWSPDGKYLVAANVFSLWIWDIEKQEPYWNESFESAIGLALRVGWSPKGNLIVGATDQELYVWDFPNKARLGTSEYSNGAWAVTENYNIRVKWNSSGTMASVALPRTIVIYEAPPGK